MPTVAEMRRLGFADPRRPAYAGHIVNLARHGTHWSVHSSALGVFGLVVDTLVDHESVHWLTVRADDWGWSVRPIRGSSSADLSYHAFGEAIDVNAETNPSVSGSAAMHTDMPVAAIHRLVKEIDRLSAGKVALEWGGDWTSLHDPMHFELHGRREDIAALSRRILAGHAKLPAKKPGHHARRVLHQGDHGLAVRHLQTDLNAAGAEVAVDGDFGPLTRSALNRFKARHHLAGTGTVDAATWRALDKAAA